MRYAIINLDNIGKCKPDTILDLFATKTCLSEEETMAKLKEIWEDGYFSGDNDMEYPAMNHYWEEFKKNL